VKRGEAPALTDLALADTPLPASDGLLRADQLCTPCDAAQFDFETTQALPEPEQPFGQARAVDAVALGLDIAGRGYNLFVLGRPGSGRHDVVRGLLQAHALRRDAPVDWCYVYNFSDPNKPRALSLPAGEGSRLRAGMQGFVGELGKAIEVAFDSEEYRSRIEAIEKEYKQREGQALQSLGKMAADQDVALLRTPQGFAFAPMKNGEPMTPEQVEALSDEERERIGHLIESMREPLLQLMHDLPRMRREMQTRVREASRETMGYAAGHLIEELKGQFAAHPTVLAYLDEVLKDVLDAGQQLREQRNDEDEPSGFTGSLSLVRYQVNLLVGHQPTDRAPVLACDNPTYANLVGRLDHQPHMGTLLTNFTLIKPGSLHLANGGYLMLDALQVLGQAYAWDGLKRALKSGKVMIESLPQVLGWVSTLALEPEPIPLSLKIVLFGERRHYYLLQALDPEFDELFKVAADFENEVPRDADHTALYARLAGSMARSAGLRALDRGAVARLVDHAARTAGDAGKLSTDTRKLDELLHEANLMAGRAGRAVIARDDVTQALAARIRRADRLRDTLHDAVLQETLLIATAGAQVGQVNGLGVIELGEFMFGHPVRITATARLGEGDLVDIERESSLGQPIHSKGVLILAAFLRSRYTRNLPFSLSASLVFEQSYSPVEGDSASLAELCALLSALAGLPLKQALAVTGSIDQAGAVQAIGGVNEKIEGFFDVCRTRGLTGEHGVLIPKANARHLMLREDVVEAAGRGLFHVYAVGDVDDAIALLTGQPAGRRDAGGRVPEGSVNHLVAARLAQMSLDRQAYATGQPRRASLRWRKPPRAPRGNGR
jgi:predicted ATP-dependent protease